MKRTVWCSLSCLLIALASCGAPQNGDPPPVPTAPAREGAGDNVSDAAAPDSYRARFTTSVGEFVIDVNREWAPRGADRFYNLVKDGYYDGARFFRVVPGFVVQFGIAADPEMTAKWDAPIPDDPVAESNQRGYVTFATSGPDTRTTQIFINYGDNSQLDSMGFAPFGKVVSGMDVVDKISSEYGEQPEQHLIEDRGNEYLAERFPNLDYVEKAEIVEASPAEPESAGG